MTLQTILDNTIVPLIPGSLERKASQLIIAGKENRELFLGHKNEFYEAIEHNKKLSNEGKEKEIEKINQYTNFLFKSKDQIDKMNFYLKLNTIIIEVFSYTMPAIWFLNEDYKIGGIFAGAFGIGRIMNYQKLSRMTDKLQNANNYFKEKIKSKD